MSGFDRLHPALQHHIVNSLGWRSLRPLQEDAIGPILDGEHALLIAPTAGGKTEAAVFPLFSRMLAEGWPGISLLYVCPLRALLNDLHRRLEGYAGLLGRRVALWHGDVGPDERRRIVRDPPDVLLTTPESLEVMLVLRRGDRGVLFGNVRAVVVDEVHAFAGDDRGWHLLSVLERVGRIAGRDLQRVGLSATIGNPEDLIGWLAGGSQGPRRVLAPTAGGPGGAEVTVDWVGSTENAALVISRLHRGEKRLVFCDSRERVEKLATELRQHAVQTFVSHSSLSREDRRQAERAFAGGEDCVIVATSTLELGIDVGDLDRVIQIDAPWTVASFLQRLGRSGRRPGTTRNCLFLATSEDAFLRACGIVNLWQKGWIEPVVPPPRPEHVLAQQVLALTLQEGAIGRETWPGWLAGVPAFGPIPAAERGEIVDHMVHEALLAEDAGMLSIGPEGEKRYGRRNFLELLSVFLSDPMIKVLYGRTELGHVHPISLAVRQEGSPVLSLGGRSWLVKHVEWEHHVAYVEPSKLPGRSRWLGLPQPLSFALCQAILKVFTSSGADLAPHLTQRGLHKMEEERITFDWARPDDTALIRRGSDLTWWTFAGLRANLALSQWMAPEAMDAPKADNLSIQWTERHGPAQTRDRLAALSAAPETCSTVPVSQDALDGLKFSDCLPRPRATRILETRLADPPAVSAIAVRPLREVGLYPAPEGGQ